MTCNQCKPEDCIAPNGWVCKNSGNFYTTGEYSHILEYYNIHGVSFKQKVDSVKMLLDMNTLIILKVLLTDYEAPSNLDVKTSLDVVATLDFIQSRLSNDNKNVFKNTENEVFNNSETIQGSGNDV